MDKYNHYKIDLHSSLIHGFKTNRYACKKKHKKLITELL